MQKLKRLLGALIVLMCLSACSNLKPQPPAALPDYGEPAREEKGVRRFTVLAEQLRVPWSIDFAEDSFYISEREGTIVQVEDGKITRQPVNTAKAVKAVGEGGLLGMVLTPNFSATGQAYAYHTYDNNGETNNRVILIQRKREGWEEVKSFIEGIPGSNVHNGGRMAIGPDQHLYITTGDAGNGELAQAESSLGGKILRMKLDGTVPEDNPASGSYVYSTGHRNAQGLAWNDAGQLYNSEHGPSGTPGGHDEINHIEAGNDYGWPGIIGDQAGKGLTRPAYHTGERTIAPSGIAFDENGHLLIAGLRGEALYRLDVENQSMVEVLAGEGRIRDVKILEGKVYIITNNTDGRGKPSEKDDRLLLLE